MNAMQGHGIDECRGGEADSLAGMSRGPGSLPDYLESALQEASRAVGTDSRRARVFARFMEWWDATMLDEIHECCMGGEPREPEWWAEKFQEFRSMADREVIDGVEL